MTDKLKVRLNDWAADPEIGTLPDDPVLFEAAVEAGWSDDPGTGHAVLIRDGYEVLNPMPFAPPIGYEATPPIEQLIRDRVKDEIDRLRDDEEVDDIVDAEDFDIPDELPDLSTLYEFMGMEREAPALKPDPKVTMDDRVKADLEYEELKEKQRLLRKRHREAALRRQAEEEGFDLGPSDTVRRAVARNEEGGD